MHSLLHIKRVNLEDEQMKRNTSKRPWQHEAKLGGIHLIRRYGKIVRYVAGLSGGCTAAMVHTFISVPSHPQDSTHYNNMCTPGIVQTYYWYTLIKVSQYNLRLL